MESKDLRLGNYIQDEAGNLEIAESLNSYGGEEINEDTATGLYEPIPLTDEWLLRFGFKPNAETKSFWYPDSNLWLRISKDTIYAYSQHDRLAKLNHVHQLQNLFYALTGEELTIKETA